MKHIILSDKSMDHTFLPNRFIATIRIREAIEIQSYTSLCFCQCNVYKGKAQEWVKNEGLGMQDGYECVEPRSSKSHQIATNGLELIQALDAWKILGDGRKSERFEFGSVCMT